MGWIAERILDEHRKYYSVLDNKDDWALIAEAKINMIIKRKENDRCTSNGNKKKNI